MGIDKLKKLVHLKYNGMSATVIHSLSLENGQIGSNVGD